MCSELEANTHPCSSSGIERMAVLRSDPSNSQGINESPNEEDRDNEYWVWQPSASDNCEEGVPGVRRCQHAQMPTSIGLPTLL